MELDELKDIWQNSEPSQQKRDEQLKILLGKQSNSPIAKMKRNLLYELIAIIFSYSAAVIYYFIAFNGRLNLVSWFVIIIALSFFVYYYHKNKLLREMEIVSGQVKSNLEQKVNTLEKYVKIYLLSGMLLVPVLTGLFAWLYYHNTITIQGVDSLDISRGNPAWKVAVIWMLISIVINIPLWFLNKWYINKLYGRHIQHLKRILMEMENE